MILTEIEIDFKKKEISLQIDGSDFLVTYKDLYFEIDGLQDFIGFKIIDEYGNEIEDNEYLIQIELIIEMNKTDELFKEWLNDFADYPKHISDSWINKLRQEN